MSEVSIARYPASTNAASLKNTSPAALLSVLVTSTSSLDSLPPESSSSEKCHVEHPNLTDVVSAYKLLLFFPVEYLTKSCRADLVKRAIIADWTLSEKLEDGNENEELLVGLSVIRMFLKRTFGFLGAVEQQSVRSGRLGLSPTRLTTLPCSLTMWPISVSTSSKTHVRLQQNQPTPRQPSTYAKSTSPSCFGMPLVEAGRKHARF